MKRRQMNALAGSLCGYLCSRNNDIAGYWGIGKLCRVALRRRVAKCSFKIRPGEILRIEGFEITRSKIVTDKLVCHDLDAIEGRMSFFKDGFYPDGSIKYICGITIAVTQGGRTGLGLCHVSCWAHSASKESRRWNWNLPQDVS